MNILLPECNRHNTVSYTYIAKSSSSHETTVKIYVSWSAAKCNNIGCDICDPPVVCPSFKPEGMNSVITDMFVGFNKSSHLLICDERKFFEYIC
jgi:hypothetical protein